MHTFMRKYKASHWLKRHAQEAGQHAWRDRKAHVHVIDEQLGLQCSSLSTLVSLHYAQAFRLLLKTSVERNIDEYQIFLDRLYLLAEPCFNVKGKRQVTVSKPHL